MSSIGSYAPRNEQLFKEIDDRYYGLRDFTMAGPDGVAIRFATELRA
jgi:hypothetical protein